MNKYVTSAAVCAFLIGCGTSERYRSLGTEMSDDDTYAYALVVPVVDPQYVMKRASQMGLVGHVSYEHGVYRVVDGSRVLVVNKTTGGLEYYDMSKRQVVAYKGTQMTAGEASTFATRFLTARGLLPESAHLGTVRLIEARDDAEAVRKKNHYEVHYVIDVDAGRDQGGVSTRGVVVGAVLVVEVGDNEVIGLVWDVPQLMRDPPVRRYPVSKAAAIIQDEARGTLKLGSPRIRYTYYPAERYRRLFPDFEFPLLSGGGHDVVRVPATPLAPWVRITGGANVSAGSQASLDAVPLGGTLPFSYEWIISSSKRVDTRISTSSKLAVNIPEDAEGLRLVATGARGDGITRSVMVTYPRSGELPNPMYKAPSLGTSIASIGVNLLFGAGWSMNWRISNSNGLELTNVAAGGTFQIARMGLPSFFILTKEEPVKTRCELTPVYGAVDKCNSELVSLWCWNGTITQTGQVSACMDNQSLPLPWKSNGAISRKIPTNPYFNRTFRDDSLVIAAQYRVRQPGAICELIMTQTYVFEPMTGGMDVCAVGNGNPCFRFYPIVQYQLVSLANPAVACSDDEVNKLWVQQRFDTDLGMGLGVQDLGAFVQDTSVVPGFNDHFVQFQEAAFSMSMSSGGTYASAGAKDNYHQRDATGMVNVPGCNDDQDWRCYHAHWRWSGLANAFDAPEHLGGTFPVGSGANPPKVPGSQTVKVAMVRQHNGEYDPFDAFSLVNAEPLGNVGNGGRNLVQWVITESDANAGLNGAGGLSAKLYDQLNMNDWFFLY